MPDFSSTQSLPALQERFQIWYKHHQHVVRFQDISVKSLLIFLGHFQISLYKLLSYHNDDKTPTPQETPARSHKIKRLPAIIPVRDLTKNLFYGRPCRPPHDE